MSEGKVEQEIERQIGETFAEIRMLQRCCGDERAERESKCVNLLVALHSHPSLWSGALCHD